MRLSGPNVTGTLGYDFLNRVTSASQTEYAYDGSNRRVWKGTVSGGTIQSETFYLYDMDGTNVGSYTPGMVNTCGIDCQTHYEIFSLTVAQARPYFFGKKLFTTEDAVGSAASTASFYPYGELKGGSATEQYGFATYWRDGESGLDYASQRYYSTRWGGS